MPMPQHMREPSMGYPDNVAYLGQAIDERLHQWLDVVLREHRRACEGQLVEGPTDFLLHVSFVWWL